jgi:hypothetical protein
MKSRIEAALEVYKGFGSAIVARVIFLAAIAVPPFWSGSVFKLAAKFEFAGQIFGFFACKRAPAPIYVTDSA